MAKLPGHIKPVRVAEVPGRLADILLTRHVEDGAGVEAGNLLFQIDPAPLKVALSRVQNGQAKAKAEKALLQALAKVKSCEQLVKIEAMSQQDFDTLQASLQSAQATKRFAQADVENARINQGYT